MSEVLERSETKHTPGPWYVESDKGLIGHWTIWADVDRVKTFVADCYEGDDALIDARLIAAVPELLAEAKELLRNATFADGQAIVLTQDCEALAAAIAKATGAQS